MKRLFLIIWLLIVAIGLNAQDCPSAFKPYTTVDFIYSCQSNINTQGQDAHVLTQTLSQDALNSLAKQFEVKVENNAVSKLLSVNGISQQSYEFSIPLAESIDCNSISAKAEDGILRIDLPTKKIEEKKSVPLTIEVQ
jgi:hypothetical protein